MLHTLMLLCVATKSAVYKKTSETTTFLYALCVFIPEANTPDVSLGYTRQGFSGYLQNFCE